MLSDTERDSLVIVMEQVFRSVAELFAQAELHFGTSVYGHRIDQATLKHQCCEFVRWAVEEQPRTLAKFLDAAIQGRALRESVADILEKLSGINGSAVPCGGNGDPVDAMLLWEEVVVLDRLHIRGQIRRMMENARPTTLVVRGPACSGKTRTADFIESLGESRGEIVAVVTQANMMSPLEFIHYLHGSLAKPDSAHSPDNLTQPPKYSELTALISHWIQERGQPCWIVVDDLCGASLELIELMESMVVRLSRGLPARLTRIVLIDYPDDASIRNAPAASVVEDQLTYEDITRDDVAEYVKWLAEVLLQEPWTADTHSESIDWIMQVGNCEGAEFVLTLGERVETFTRGVLSGQRGTP